MDKTLMQKHPEHTPPKFALRFLEWFCPPDLYEGIEGDLLEKFSEDMKIFGATKARRRFAWHVIRFFRPGIVLRNKFSVRLNHTFMLRNYLKVAARNIQKRKLYSFINAFGLSIALAFCMLIYLYIEDERSFDQFHVNKDRIYRIEEVSYQYWNPNLKEENRYVKSAYLQVGLKDALKSEVPEVEYATRFNSREEVVKYGDKIFQEDIAYTDRDFFKMFSFKLLAGNTDKLFRNQFDVVITPEIAEKYFGKENPLGKALVIGSEKEVSYIVSGIIEAPPANSSIDFNILIPQENRKYYEQQLSNWTSVSTPTFIQLFPQADARNLDRNLQMILDKYLGKDIKEWRIKDKIPDGIKLLEYRFSRMPEWHFNKEVAWHKVSNPQYSLILGAIAIGILLIATINYVSLALTTSASRRKEVGIRKVAGAFRNQLVAQFGFESVLLAFFSMVLGIGLVILFLPVFNEFTGKGIAVSYENMPSLILTAMALTVVVGTLAGSYPALYLSAFRPAVVLKGRFTGRVHAGFTKPLVVLQFALSGFLIISSLIMYRQMRFIAEKDLGYDQEHVLVIPTQRGWTEESVTVVEQFRTRLQREPEVLAVAGTSVSFSHGLARQGYKIDGEDKISAVYIVDPFYIPTLGLELIHGRNFDPNITADSNAVIVNESLVRNMKWTDLDNAYLNWRQDSTGMGAKVIGVLKDYHYRSLEAPIEPLFLTLGEQGNGALTTMLVRIVPGKAQSALEKISNAWRQLYPDKPFDYSFLDDDVAEQYESQQRWLKIMGLSTAFAILISCLGLFGLAGINAMNRTKEIGIRKVLGADLASIFALVNRQYIWLSLIAFVLAIPFSWYAMNRWLSAFQFRITIRWELFAISMAVGLAVALLTVSYHGIKAAMVNPAETLKSE